MPKDNITPAFLLYAQDFVSDSKVEAMTTQEVGAYFLLLCKAWFEKPVATIPNNDRVLARWARLTPDDWAVCRDAVLSPFKDCKDGRLLSPRLFSEYRKLMEDRKKKSHAAKIAANTRWGNNASGMRNACESHSERNATGMPENAISNSITTPNPLTRNVKNNNNPIGGLGDCSDLPDCEAPRVFNSSSDLGSWVRGFESPSEIPWETLTAAQVFTPFKSLFVANGIRDARELQRVVSNAKTTPVRWTALFLDKVAWAWQKVNGKIRLDAHPDTDVVALTAAGFNPKNGKAPHSPPNSAMGLFKEIFFDVVGNPDGRGKKWEHITGIAISAELTKRKGKRR